MRVEVGVGAEEDVDIVSAFRQARSLEAIIPGFVAVGDEIGVARDISYFRILPDQSQATATERREVGPRPLLGPKSGTHRPNIPLQLRNRDCQSTSHLREAIEERRTAQTHSDPLRDLPRRTQRHPLPLEIHHLAHLRRLLLHLLVRAVL